MITTRACHPINCQMWQLQIKHLIHACALAFITVFFVLPETGLANNELTLSDNDVGNIPLLNVLEFYDPGLQEPDFDAIKMMNNTQWRGVTKMSPTLIFSLRKTQWFRLVINNNGTLPQRLALNNSNPLSDSMNVYLCDKKNEWDCEKKPKNENDQETSFITLPAESRNILYIEITGFHSAFSAISLQSIDYFYQKQYNNKLYSGIIDGIIIGLTLYTLLLAVKTKQMMYYAYVFLGISNLLTAFLHQNFFADTISFINYEWKTNFSLVMPLFVTVSITQFIRNFIETRKNHPSIDKLLQIYIVFTVFIAAAFLLGSPMIILLPPFIISSSIATFLMIYLCAINKQHLRTSITMLAIGLTMPALSGFLTLLTAIGAVTADIGYMNIMQTFDALEMMLFSLAMLSSVKHLENEHQRQAESALEASIISEAHNRLLAHLNHELRTPLNGILGAAEILVHKSHPRDRHIFSMICHTALPLKHLIDEMVNIRSVTENKKYLQNTRFDLQGLLQECMDVFLPIANEKRIRLFFRVEHDIANDVTGDPNRLRQILLNLIGNACKFTTDGEVGLHVRKQTALSETKCLYYFEVTDSGMGISKADEQRLFGIFETGNTTANPGGAGLGLSIVRELSELLGGSCGYENNDDVVGSKFWFSAILEPHQQVSRKTHKAFENLHILIADESRLICDQILHQISDTARTISTANSAQALQQALETQTPDVAIIHQTLFDNEIIKKSSSKKTFFITYSDHSESINTKKNSQMYHEDSIIRKTSTEAFSLQIADTIIKKSNLLYRNPEETIKIDPMKILAADDIPANQNIIRELITSLNFTAVICSNGRQAFELYLQHLLDGSPFDAIIMDCEMPIQDGFETTSQIRDYENAHNLKPTPVIALTAHTEAAYRRRSEEAGMNAYLAKPVTAERILQCLLDATNT